jgi:hypothetical protein
MYYLNIINNIGKNNKMDGKGVFTWNDGRKVLIKIIIYYKSILVLMLMIKNAVMEFLSGLMEENMKVIKINKILLLVIYILF